MKTARKSSSRRRRGVALAALAVVVTLLCGGCGVADAFVGPPRSGSNAGTVSYGATAVAANTHAGDLVFADEFDSPAGSGPNEGLSHPVWFNDGCSTSGCMGTLASFRPENAQQDGQGNLVLTASEATRDDSCGPNNGRCLYTSSRLTMLDWAHGGRQSWSALGGHWEARIKAPVGAGLWPAFWTVGDEARLGWPGAGEIDIFEAVGQRPSAIAQYAHGANAAPGMVGPSVPLGGGTIGDWHTYAIDWDPSPDGYIAWSIDGQVRKILRAADAGAGWSSVMNPQSMILDLAVGGWAGKPDPAAFPARMFVDYIRVYTRPQFTP